MNAIFTSLETLIFSVLESCLIIIIAALLVGAVIKKWIPDSAVQSKWIPTINIVLGGILGMTTPSFPNAGMVTQAIYGAMCGFAASLLYDKVILIFSKKKEMVCDAESDSGSE